MGQKLNYFLLFLSKFFFVIFTYVTLTFLQFENLPVHTKLHETPVCFLTMNLTVSIQLSNCLSSYNINIDLLAPVPSLPVTVTVAISERAPTVTASGTVTCLSCVARLSATANKTTLRLSDHCPDVSVWHVNNS